jgi:hypothetical protein
MIRMDAISAVLFFILFIAVFGSALKDTNIVLAALAALAALGLFSFFISFSSTDYFLRILMIILGIGLVTGSVVLMKN